MRYLKYLFLLLLSSPLFAQRVHITVSPGEYTTIALRHDSLFDFTSGKPVFVQANVAAIYAGAHNYNFVDKQGFIWANLDNSTGQFGNGNQTGSGTPQKIVNDSSGNPLPQIAQMCLGATLYGGFWITAAVGIDGTLYVAGNTQGGARGNGTDGYAVSNKFVKVNFPPGVKIKKVQIGAIMMALDTDGNVWTWGGGGDAYKLGQGNSPIWRTPTKINLGLGVVAADIAGGTNWNYALISDGRIFGWGGQYYTDYNGTYPQLASNTTVPIDLTGYLSLPVMPVKIYVNNESTYAILADSTGWAWGGNACGSIGNGDEIDYARYGGYPVPYGTTNPFPYAWDQGKSELQVFKPVQIAPGKHNFTDIYVTNALCYTAYATDANNLLFAWGRDKQSICYGLTPANPSNGAQQSTYPNSWDQKFPRLIDPFSVISVFQSPSPYCRNHTSAACSIFNIPAHGLPTASLLLRSIGGGRIVWDATNSSDPSFIFSSVITQISGTALKLGIQNQMLDTFYNVPNGTYVFRLSIVNGYRDSTATTASITVGASSPPTVNPGNNQTLSSQTTQTILSATATPNGGATIASYSWVKTSGPAGDIIALPNSATTQVTGLVPGVYKYSVTVTDSNNAATTATVTITVSSSPTQYIPHLRGVHRKYISN